VSYRPEWCTARTLLNCVTEKWSNAGIKAVVEKSRLRRVANDTIVLCASNSFKGYAEIIVVAGIEQFMAEKEILPHHLYVAMTRARSPLAVFSWARSDENNMRLVRVIEQCLNNLLVSQTVERSVSRLDELHDLLDAVGDEHRSGSRTSGLHGRWSRSRSSRMPGISLPNRCSGSRTKSELTPASAGSSPRPTRCTSWSMSGSR
jgi:hypothetical protein